MPRRWVLPAEQVLAGPLPPCDFHLHTSWTDGKASVGEMHAAAVACGLEAMLFSEHARKTSGDWFPDFAAEVRALPKSPCRAYVGVECKVDGGDGAVDLSGEIAQLCDLVMASVHRFPDGSGGALDFKSVPVEHALEIEFGLAMAVLDNPAVDILGHPFGMAYERFKRVPGEAMWLELARKAARTGVALDISARYHPDPKGVLELCALAGALVTLGSDAHDAAHVGSIQRVLRGEAS